MLFAAMAAAGCGASTANDQAAAAPPALAPASPPPPPPPVADRLHHGIDVSGHSGTVDWEKVVAAGHTYAFAKATEGIDLVDPLFDQHWSAMKAAGIIRGAYHFYVTEDDPEQQASFFISTAKLGPGDLAPVVDIELIGHGTQQDLADRLSRFLERIEAHYGIRPIIYTSRDFWNEHLDNAFGGYPLWVAEYDVDAPNLPAGWHTWHLWQWRGDADVPGVEKSADLSRVNRDGPDLSALILSE